MPICRLHYSVYLQELLLDCLMRFAQTLALCSLAIPTVAQGTTPEELLDRVEAEFSAAPRAEVLREVSDRKGKFVEGSLYVFCLDAKGVVVANGGFNSIIGKHAEQIKLAHVGEIAAQTLAEMRDKQNGEVDYRWFNPQSGVIERKHAILRRIGKDICGAGTYEPLPVNS